MSCLWGSCPQFPQQTDEFALFGAICNHSLRRFIIKHLCLTILRRHCGARGPGVAHSDLEHDRMAFGRQGFLMLRQPREK